MRKDGGFGFIGLEAVGMWLASDRMRAFEQGAAMRKPACCQP